MSDMDTQTTSTQTTDTQTTNTQTTNTTQTGTQTSTTTDTTDFRAIFGDYASDPSIQKFKTPADLAKSYIELERLIG